MVFGANDHSSIINHDVVRIEGTMVVRVCIGRENDRASVGLHQLKFWGIVNVDEEAEALRDSNTFAIDWKEEVAPSRLL